jgi:hypothetical protein
MSAKKTDKFLTLFLSVDLAPNSSDTINAEKPFLKDQKLNSESEFSCEYLAN